MHRKPSSTCRTHTATTRDGMRVRWRLLAATLIVGWGVAAAKAHWWAPPLPSGGSPTIGSGFPGPPPPVQFGELRRFQALYMQFLQLYGGHSPSATHFVDWLRMNGVWHPNDLAAMLALYHWMEQLRRSA